MRGSPVSLSPLSPDAFRRCVGEFATGVTVVTAEHEDGPAGMTLNSFTSVSLNPLLLLVALGHSSRTLQAVRSAERFAVSVLGRGQRDAAIAFATRGAPFAASYVRRDADGFLVVRGAVAALKCELADAVRAGDHDLAIGRVVAIDHPGGDPLIFHRGVFGGLVTDAAVPPGHPIGLDEGAGW